MKTISIGSSKGCNICINDASVSKQHALILISEWGKLQIVNLGETGTTVNGVRIQSRVPVPLKRGNVVSIGNVYELDWRLIPNPRKKYIFIICAILTILAIAILAIIYCSLNKLNVPSDFNQPTSPVPSSEIAITDNNAKKRDNVKGNEQVLQDSILTPQQLWVRSGKIMPKKSSESRKQQNETPSQKHLADSIIPNKSNMIDSVVGEDVPLDIEIEILEEDTTSLL